MPDPTAEFAQRMRADGQPESVISAFADLYRAYVGGGAAAARFGDFAPPGEEFLVRMEDLAGRGGGAPLDRLAWIVLNGGIGTSMRMEKAKSLLTVHNGLSFLDLIAEFVKRTRNNYGIPLPVLFMDSYATSRDTLEALMPHGLEVGGLPLDFVQHRFPRIRAEDGMPFGRPEDDGSYAPPGHGDIFLSLAESGTLDRLRRLGIKWLFVSNADNLGAAPSVEILGYMAAEGLEMLIEVTPKTEADRKGGSLVMADGRLSLLEIAQVPGPRVADFMDRTKFPAFNTNNVWITLDAAARIARGECGRLPLIINRKTVCGVEVVQLEQAMGAAVGCLDRTGGVVVSRRRFAPVKTTADLVVRRSDCYEQGINSPLEPVPGAGTEGYEPLVKLDERFYMAIHDLNMRLPHPLGLKNARSLTVTGDVRFGRGVTVLGEATVENKSCEPLWIKDGAVLGKAA